MTSIQISNETARKLIIKTQSLNGQTKFKSIIEGLDRTFDQLGYIQIDTINVVERAHNHILWTRLPGYKNNLLHDYQTVDRKVFEYWGHAMSYLPMSDYRFFLPKMKRFEDPSHPWVLNMYKNGKQLLKPVMDRIRAEGPLSSKDFSRPENQKTGTWWDWKPAKYALEYLFWRGDLMISERRNFQKIYDLTERVLPSDINTQLPDEKEIAEYLIKRALKAMGVASEKEINSFMQPNSARDSDFRAVNREVISRTIGELLEQKIITRVQVGSNNTNSDYALTTIINPQQNLRESRKSVYFLSPFDNLIIQRDRVKRLFDFNYTLECYVPGPKRVHGYFVHPILYGNNLIGRFDPKADRNNKIMILNRLAFEKEFKFSEAFIICFVKKLIDFAMFNNCNKIIINQVEPEKMKTVLKAAIKKQQGW
ncbi:MAG TPA: winged helix-turn-helix domain-containing protein [Caldithrix sp.]|nr:YcaQ family DNA glycosylase [Calditrichaceae bacterium]HEM48902.1 winged helix-turn-helix domain-containing protein [Caldithrix sp.]